MKKVQLSEVFTGDSFRAVSAHIDRIEKILKEYDVVIFMARKAICFYEALKNNGEIEPTKCRVVSSRVIYYNTLNSYRNKRVAVVDDVVVRGKSISRVAAKLKEVGIEADYYVAACEEKFKNEFNSNNDISIQTYVVYPQGAIYSFSGLITQYIEASMRTFNVDSPIYEINNSYKTIENILNTYSAVNLTSGLQAQYDIRSKSIYYSYESSSKTDSLLSRVLYESILKIRFYYNDERVIAVPFVLLPACTTNDLEELYRMIFPSEIDDFISIGNDRRIRENKYKLISYYLSDVLFCHFVKQHSIICIRDELNDITQFDRTLDQIVSKKNKTELLAVMSNLSVCETSFSSFLFTDYIRNAYQFVSKWDPDAQLYEDSTELRYGVNEPKDEKLNRIAFAFSDLLDWINTKKTETKDNKTYVSSVIDIFVDMGFIVPAILHTNTNMTLRAYKMGEYSKLTRDQINSFIRMLYSYQTSVDRELDKTEFEKLCVLYFKTSILTKPKCFRVMTSFDEGAYGIAYSYYGPRLVSTDSLYFVPNGSADITDLIDEDILRKSNDKYYLLYNREVDDEALDIHCVTFAAGYVKLSEVFKEYPYIPNQNQGPLSSNVHSLDQFLTLLAVGLDVRDQILSLCAEIYFVTKLHEDMFWVDLSKLSVRRIRGYLKGINSGLWKYRCYKENALISTMRKIRQINNEASFIPSQALMESGDASESVSSFLDECGRFLYKAAYAINTLLVQTNRVPYFRIDDENKSLSKNRTTSKNEIVFQAGNYYYTPMDEERKNTIQTLQIGFKTLNEKQVIRGAFSSLQKEARMLLDKCDLYLETNGGIGSTINNYLIVHSNSGKLPEQYGTVAPCSLEGITKDRTTAVFPITYPTDLSRIISTVFEVTISINDCDYLLVNGIKSKYAGFVQVDTIAKGKAIKDDILKLMEYVHNKPKAGKHLFVYQGENTIDVTTFERIKLNKLGTEKYDERGVIITYSVTLERRQEMTIYGDYYEGDHIGDNATLGANYKAKISGENNANSTDLNVSDHATIGSVTTSTVLVENSGNTITMFNGSKTNECLGLLDALESRISNETSMSTKEFVDINENIKVIRTEMEKQIPDSSKVEKAYKMIKEIASGVKGTFEFFAAVTALVNFLAPMFP